MNWKYTKRRINGKIRKIKYHRKSDGGYLVRIVGHRNAAD